MRLSFESIRGEFGQILGDAGGGGGADAVGSVQFIGLIPNPSNMELSLPQFMNFKLFGKTISVVDIKFGLFWGHPLSKRELGEGPWIHLWLHLWSRAWMLCRRFSAAMCCDVL